MVQFYVQILTNFPYHVHKNVLTLPVSLSTGSYTKDEPNFPQSKVSCVDKVVYFKDFSRRLVKFKTFSRL